MFEGFMKNLVDVEQLTRDKIQVALENAAEETGEKFDNIFLMIRPVDAEFNHKYFIGKFDEKGNPKVVREMALKEILNDKE